jgi:prepilin-type N-terminal cleavage/methylation domain-containing protein
MRSANEEGFTLIELIIAIAILGIVIPSLGGAVIALLHNSNATNQRLVQSHDAQIAAAFFANDVESADVSPTATSPLSSTDGRCDNGATPILRLAWTEYDTTQGVASPHVAAYKLAVYGTSGPASAPVLHRYFCTGANHGSALSLTSSVVIASNLASLGSATAVVDSCPGGYPRGVTLTVTDATVGGVPGYVLQLTGTRRTSAC